MTMKPLNLALTLTMLSSYSLNAAPPLPGAQAKLDHTSVSGLSSGAFMTSQFFVAHSSIMKGAGIVAGGPYLCAQSWPNMTYFQNATTTCMNPFTSSTGPNTPLLLKKTQELSDSGDIDNIDHISNARIYLFSGKEDTTVSTLVMDKTLEYYQQLGVKDSAIWYNHWTNAGHAFVTNKADDNPCSKTEPPYINNCDIDQSKRILNHIYPGLNEPMTQLSSEPMAFDQREFIDHDFTSMSDTGYVYIPEQCQQAACSIHVVFHGCQQGAELIGDKYYSGTGYNEMADANNLIVLYPQVRPSTSKRYNPKGCWDFWGYTSPSEASPDYFSKSSPQVSAVYRMVERLASAKN